MIIGGIIKEAIGPLPKICQETVLRDLERARMSAEDLRTRAISADQIDRVENLIIDAQTEMTRGIIWTESRSDFCVAFSRTHSILADARRALDR